ncbi:hypothetical protein PR202_ga02741 [Eleusine coracana subsp. coracana]|uniref:Glutaredoxin domain-containing protein n=1 Tax=Eleusine coracana subsp. coracana TaxID=191504 RepID=A0AAV5BLK1_ELECO|nr:hypothetical protein PR202_ga02741 [Eleusine coracana subsp. coracana]
MGCTGSRHAVRGGGGRSPYARSCSGPALKSSTLGSLSLDRGDEEMMKWRDDDYRVGVGGVAAAKTPPTKQQVNRRQQKQKQVLGSPAKTPAREPEVINVWEEDHGLDEDEREEADDGRAKSAPGSPEFDPDIIAAFRKALDEDAAVKKRDGKADEEEEEEVGVKKREIQKFPGIVRARVSAFQQRIDAKLAKLAPSPPPQAPSPPDSARKVVIYLTSLRGIRKTYEDCWSTRSILQGYGVRVDERDLSMHTRVQGRAPRGARVFTDGREHLGGAEEVRRMHEAGELSRELEACEMAPPPGVGPGKGGARRGDGGVLRVRRGAVSCRARSAPAAARCTSRRSAASGGAPSATRTAWCGVPSAPCDSVRSHQELLMWA